MCIRDRSTTTATSGQNPQGQGGPRPVTASGCLRAGDTAGTYMLTDVQMQGGGRSGDTTSTTAGTTAGGTTTGGTTTSGTTASGTSTGTSASGGGTQGGGRSRNVTVTSVRMITE